MNLMTIMYIAIQEALSDPEDMSSSYNKLRMSRIPPPLSSRQVCADCTNCHKVELNPSLVDFMLTATSKLRWDEQSTMPHMQVMTIPFTAIYTSPLTETDFPAVLEIHPARLRRDQGA